MTILYVDIKKIVEDHYKYINARNYLKQKGEKMNGKVKFFNATKGFGFITVEGQKDVFVHYTGIKGVGRRQLKEGVEVTFDITKGKNGDQATNVSED